MRALRSSRYSLSHANNPSCRNKAVAEGAVSLYLSHFVSVRVTRFAYGTSCVVEYKPDDPEHVKRRGRVYTRPSGRMVIPNSYNMILAKVSLHRSGAGAEFADAANIERA